MVADQAHWIVRGRGAFVGNEPTQTAEATETAVGRPSGEIVLPAVGQPVGRYMILGELGAGAMGTVFLASDAQLGRRVALKLLTYNSRDNRLLDEARALARLQHPNVVTIHDVGFWQERVYMAMEYVAGVSLEEWLKSHTGWKERLGAFRQAASGLAAAHRAGIIHHDVKPTNIMVGNDGRVRIVDFGLARSMSPDFAEGSPGGTPRYMSPEQRRGEVADARTDQFSLCVALYEALFDVHPFPGESAAEREGSVLTGQLRVPPASKVPATIRDAVLQGLALDRSARHPDMDALIDSIALPRSQRAIWLAAGAGVLAIAATVSAVTMARSHTKPGKWDAILGSSHLVAEQHEPLPGDPYQMTVHRLSNGLTVYISPNRGRPRVRTLLRFHAGSADAPGVAALAQGLSYKGTERFGTVDYAAEKPHLDRIEELYKQRSAITDPVQRARLDEEIDKESVAAGPYEVTNEYSRILQDFATVMNNGRTAHDETRFEVEIASNRFAEWAELEGDRWAHPVFRQFRANVADTLGWISAGSQGLDARLSISVGATLFAGHPYGSPVGTQQKVLETEPYVEATQFFRERFVPNNAELYIVGDIDPVTAIPVLEKAFAAWEPRALPPRKRPVVRPYAGGDPVSVPSTSERRITYAWAAPPESSPATPALFVTNEIVRKLGHDPHINFSRMFDFRDDATIYTVVAIPADGTSLDVARSALDRILQQVRDGTFSENVLEGAKRNLRVNWLLGVRDNASRLFRLARMPIGAMPWAERLKLDQAEARVTRADVMRVAREILGKPHATIRVEPGPIDVDAPHPPHVPAAKFSEQRSPAAKALVEREVVPIQPKTWLAGRDYQEQTTPKGLVVAVADRKTELFDLDFFYNVGTAEIPAICNLLDVKLHEHLGELLWRYGIQHNVTCGARTIDIELEGLDADLPHAIEVFEGLLEDPPAAEWAEEAADARRWISDLRGRPDYISNALYSLAMYGPQHPLFLSVDASQYASPAVAHDSLDLLRNTERSIGYHGPRPIDEVIALLPAKPDGKAAELRATKLLPVTGPRVFVLDAPTLSKEANVDIMYGLPGTPITATAEQSVYEMYWNPMAHPLAQRLRGITVPRFVVMRPWVSRDDAYGDFQFKATAKNIASVIDQLLAEIPHPSKPELMDGAKATWEAVLRSNWSEPQDLPLEVLKYRLNGLQGDPAQDLFARLPSLGNADYDKVTQALLGSPRTITIWGNLAGLDRKALAKLGTVSEVKIDDLFPAAAHP